MLLSNVFNLNEVFSKICIIMLRKQNSTDVYKNIIALFVNQGWYSTTKTFKKF
jgi:hypothetical protein